MNMNQKFLSISIVLLGIVIWLASGIFIVQLNEQAAILNFGSLNRICNPGLNWHAPWPIETKIVSDVTSLHKITTSNLIGSDDDMLVLTNDENMLSVQFTIFWRVRDLASYLFRAKAPDEIVESAAETIMREIMSNTLAQDALTVGRQAIADQIKVKLQTLIDEYAVGVEIVDAQMGKIDPPESVIDAYRDVLKAKLEQETQKNQAESYAHYLIPKAKGEAFDVYSRAKAAESKILAEAEGEVRAATALLEVFNSSPSLTLQIMYNNMMATVLRKSKVRVIEGQLPVFYMADRPISNGPTDSRNMNRSKS